MQPKKIMIMEKRTYIQPLMAVEEVHPEAFVMLLDSGSGTEPGKAPAQRAATPTNPVMPLDSVAVF